jgi:coproporphyrinogen III oxidase-like Fe-S oxidoreductase
MKEVMMLGFRLDDGIDGDAFHSRFGIRMEVRFGQELAGLLARGLIACDHRGARLTPLGRDIANQVFMAFV